ncbi:hypothetical protein Kuja_0410 [Vibrio phage vB_VchM_Kuja]|uniref:Uncharacterized protein n=1 Tax=Vibrio phage vB_VchM_Kuja TaxID=2686437 RepID=A0A6B9JBT7_9CAUD|nr:hypothetical protein HWC83_gp041 [Vibrio phage vB_VchM_Kuja]QGZ16032.1 hypothetical protein Kuja_0410 [Vibrio phage vB_VchM_Kuja]
MFYDYKCGACGHIFGRQLSMADRKQPESEPCPSCAECGTITQVILSAPVSMEPHLVKDKRPSGWKEILKTAHNYAGRHSGIDL